MNERVDLVYLEERFYAGDVEAGKELVARESNFVMHFRATLIQSLCMADKVDDPKLLHFLLEHGATLTHNTDISIEGPFNLTLLCRKPRLLRALLDVYDNKVPEHEDICPMLCFTNKREKQACMRIIVDAGHAELAKLDPLKHVTDFASVLEYAQGRECARSAAILILGVLRCRSRVTGKNGKDVLLVVARCVWGTRGFADDNEWIVAATKNKISCPTKKIKK